MSENMSNSSTPVPEYSILNVTDITSSSVSLLWNIASNATESMISCEANFTNTSVDSILNHAVTYRLSVNSSLSASTNFNVEGLQPATNYNCCITTAEANTTCQTLTTNDTQSQGMSTLTGLSPAEAGALGGFLGCFITLVIALIVAAVLVSVLLTVKRKRAIARAKTRPVLRSDSRHYKRKEISAQKSQETETTPTQHTQVTPPPQSTPTTPLPQTKHTPLPAKPRDPQKSATAPGHLHLKPMLPLKPPIKQKPFPLRRAKSQPDAFLSQVDQNVDNEHIYDDADLSFKTRRIVSRENVAYDMEEEAQREYELL